MKWLENKAINRGYIAKQLYGNSESAARKKISLKVRGKQQWTDAELEKLEQIREQIKSEL